MSVSVMTNHWYMCYSRHTALSVSRPAKSPHHQLSSQPPDNCANMSHAHAQKGMAPDDDIMRYDSLATTVRAFESLDAGLIDSLQTDRDRDYRYEVYTLQEKKAYIV